VSAAYPKRPARPAGPLVRLEEDVLVEQPVLWRIHRTVGDHVLPWSALRHWGPAATMRFDPHPPPPGEHREVGVTYTALDIATAVTETFQQQRVIDTAGGRPKATAWRPTRPLRMLNLTDDWALRNGASHSLASGSRATCRTWARVIAETWPDLDGLWSQSTLTGRPNVTLWTPAADTFPMNPDFSEYLDAALMWRVLREITDRYPTFRLI
jgi:hypothetical protein